MKKKPTGMLGFSVVVVGQVISLLGSGMTAFGISIYAYQLTGEATTLSLLAFTGFAPVVLFSPLAGALVDRMDRKLVMMLSDIAAGLTTVMVFLLLRADNLEIWHLFIANFISGAFQAFQFPAYSAAVSMMVPKEQYGRANGLMSLAGPASAIFSPVLAATFLSRIGLEGIMMIDIISFSAAVIALLFVYIPNPEKTEVSEKAKGNLWQESLFGFRYIFKRPSLLGLQMIFFLINLVSTLGFTLMTPMILARTANNQDILSQVMSVGSVGGLAGGLLLSAWGGPKKKIHGVLLGMISLSIIAEIGMGLGKTALVWATVSFFSGLILPILNGSSQAIWQSKVEPELQGRVFSVRRWIAQITAPIGMLAAGPLADKVFEPAMQENGIWVNTFGFLVGSGPGAGMALIFILAGILGVFVGILGYLIPVVRNVEALLPDHDVDVIGIDHSPESLPDEDIDFTEVATEIEIL